MPGMSRQLPDWLNQNSPVVAPIPQATQMPAGGGMMGAPKKKRGFFDKLADAGMAWSAGMGVPSAMRFMEMEEERRRDDARRQQLEYAYGRKRDDDWADFVRKEQFKRENPNPGQSEFDRALVNAGIDPASEEGRRLYRQRATNMADPIQGVPFTDEQGNSGVRFIRPSQLGGPSAPPRLDALPPGAVPIGQGGAGSGPRPFP